ncbi:MAG TPA: precorrin-4 C(11)-methyltransferase [Desulfomicrobiaceae bacterium]|nr:precorrin-4 C(11)-methyltransferase [Desulfomicrobiaceae bacterium]
MPEGRVVFIGAGPGDPELITVKGQRIVQEADLVLYAGSLVPREVVGCARPGADVRDSAPMTLDETHAVMLAAARQGKLVARVHTGDPSIYGAVREQARLLERDGIPYEIIPGVTSACAAAARAAVSFTVPERTQSLIITRMAGRTPVPEMESIRALAAHRTSMVVYLSANRGGELQEELEAAGLEPETRVVIGRRIGHPDEEVVYTCVGDLARVATEMKLTRQAVFLVLPGEDGKEHLSKLYDAGFIHGFRQETGA